MKNIFLSHATPDKELIVRPFAKRLDQDGITYWLDEAEIKWGDKLGKSINRGLNESRYVVVFLSESFVGRNWPEAELSAALSRENDEGKNIVLPIVIGDPKKILSSYPLLRDKIYKKWDDGIDSCIESLNDLIVSDRNATSINVKVHNTLHTVEVDPSIIIQLLGKLNSHAVYPPSYFAKVLVGSGLLIHVAEDSESIVINGHAVESINPDFGERGIWSLDIATVLWKLLLERDFPTHFFGRGKQYRHLLVSLRFHLLGIPIPEEFSKVGAA